MIRSILTIIAVLFLAICSVYVFRPHPSATDEIIARNLFKYLENAPPEQVAKLLNIGTHPSAVSKTPSNPASKSAVNRSSAQEARRTKTLETVAAGLSRGQVLLGHLLRNVPDVRDGHDPGNDDLTLDAQEILRDSAEFISLLPSNDPLFDIDRSSLLELSHRLAKLPGAHYVELAKTVFKKQLEVAQAEPLTPGKPKPSLQALGFFLEFESNGEFRQTAIDAVMAKQTDPDTLKLLKNLSVSNRSFIHENSRSREASVSDEKSRY